MSFDPAMRFCPLVDDEAGEEQPDGKVKKYSRTKSQKEEDEADIPHPSDDEFLDDTEQKLEHLPKVTDEEKHLSLEEKQELLDLIEENKQKEIDELRIKERRKEKELFMRNLEAKRFKRVQTVQSSESSENSRTDSFVTSDDSIGTHTFEQDELDDSPGEEADPGGSEDEDDSRNKVPIPRFPMHYGAIPAKDIFSWKRTPQTKWDSDSVKSTATWDFLNQQGKRKRQKS
jgi:hypothetical protein